MVIFLFLCGSRVKCGHISVASVVNRQNRHNTSLNKVTKKLYYLKNNDTSDHSNIIILKIAIYQIILKHSDINIVHRSSLYYLKITIYITSY